VEAYFRFVHLEEVFEQLAEADDALRVARDRRKLAQVLGVQRTEGEVDLVPLVADVAEGSN